MPFYCTAMRSRNRGRCTQVVEVKGGRCAWHPIGFEEQEAKQTAAKPRRAVIEEAEYVDLPGGSCDIVPGDPRILSNGPQWAAAEMLGLTDTPEDVAAGRAQFANSLTCQQVEIVELLLEWRRVAVRGAHSLGKSMLLSFLIWWWLVRQQNNMVLVLSAKADQSAQTLFPEALTHWERCYGPRPAKASTRTLYVDRAKYPYWRATILSGSRGESISSYHPRAPGSVLLLVDEASAIVEELAASMEGLMSSDHSYCLACGNALNTSLDAPFRRFFRDPRWYPYHWKTREHPNFLAHDRQQRLPYPTAISPSWYYQFRDAVGADDPEFLARCEGEFPEVDPDESRRRIFDAAAVARASGMTVDQVKGLQRVSEADDKPESMFPEDFEHLGVWSQGALAPDD